LGKLRVLSSKEVCRILEDHGFRLTRQRGSHLIMQLRIDAATVTIPIPERKELRTGTLRSIIRQSGLPRFLFEE